VKEHFNNATNAKGCTDGQKFEEDTNKQKTYKQTNFIDAP